MRTIRLAILAGILIAWKLASGRLIAEFIISKPTEVAQILFEWIASGNLFYHAAITAYGAFLGFTLGAAIGISIGLFLGRAQKNRPSH